MYIIRKFHGVNYWLLCPYSTACIGEVVGRARATILHALEEWVGGARATVLHALEEWVGSSLFPFYSQEWFGVTETSVDIPR